METDKLINQSYIVALVQSQRQVRLFKKVAAVECLSSVIHSEIKSIRYVRNAASRARVTMSLSLRRLDASGKV